MKLLITATIDTKGTPFNKRVDHDLRLNDTIIAINKWFKSGIFISIVIVENSNNISKIKGNLIVPSGLKVEFLGYDGQNFPRQFGKGFGVYEAISYALKHSILLSSNSDICVVPGRYFIKNVNYILNNLTCGFSTGLSNNLTYSFTPMLVANPKIFLTYIFPQFEKMDESCGNSFEHQLAKAVLIAVSDGIAWELPIEPPIIDGVSGTSNLRYYTSWHKTFLTKFYFRVKKFMFEYRI